MFFLTATFLSVVVAVTTAPVFHPTTSTRAPLATRPPWIPGYVVKKRDMPVPTGHKTCVHGMVYARQHAYRAEGGYDKAVIGKYNATGGQVQGVFFQDELRLGQHKLRGVTWADEKRRSLLILTDAHRVIVVDEDDAGALGPDKDDTPLGVELSSSAVSSAVSWVRAEGVFWVTDATDRVYRLDDDLALVGSVRVGNGTMNGVRLGDLEWINGAIWALSTDGDEMFVLSPASGDVLMRVSLEDVSVPKYPGCCALCGFDQPRATAIAFDTDRSQLWIAGSDWNASIVVDVTTATGESALRGGGLSQVADTKDHIRINATTLLAVWLAGGTVIFVGIAIILCWICRDGSKLPHNWEKAET